jgi:hypothetical protein
MSDQKKPVQDEELDQVSGGLNTHPGPVNPIRPGQPPTHPIDPISPIKPPTHPGG